MKFCRFKRRNKSPHCQIKYFQDYVKGTQKKLFPHYPKIKVNNIFKNKSKYMGD